jgi:hypothetical protein
MRPLALAALSFPLLALRPERLLAQTIPTELPRTPATGSKLLTLSLSHASVAPGAAAALVVVLNSSMDNEPLALQWQISYPSPQIGIDSRQIAADSAAKSVGKKVTCAGKPEGASAYTYTCIVAGGTKPMHSGPIARFPLRVRDSARTGMVTITLTGAISVRTAGLSAHLADSAATLQIR